MRQEKQKKIIIKNSFEGISPLFLQLFIREKMIREGKKRVSGYSLAEN
jgi:hypothetical protein